MEPQPITLHQRRGSLRADGRRQKIRLADVRGRYTTWRRWAFALLIVVYAAAPLVKVGGRPLIFLDIAQRRFYLFGATFNAQDSYLLFFLVAGAVGGMVWILIPTLARAYADVSELITTLLLNFVGVFDQVTSGPPVIASQPTPVLYLLFQPRPWSSSAPASGSGPTSEGSPAPCVLPKLWPPAISATVSSSFIAMRRKVSRMSIAALRGSGSPFGPSGFT